MKKDSGDIHRAIDASTKGLENIATPTADMLTDTVAGLEIIMDANGTGTGNHAYCPCGYGVCCYLRDST